MHCIDIPCKGGSLEELKSFTTQLFEDLPHAQGELWKLELILEELFVNAVIHSQTSTFFRARIVVDHESIHCLIEDDGAAFNPLGRETPDTTLPIEERSIGGLGLHFVSKLSDESEYHRAEPLNCLQLVINITDPPPPTESEDADLSNSDDDLFS